MSNLFDTFHGSDYIPIPFSAYAQAGEMQQGKYNQLQDQLQQQQDQFAAMKVRGVDQPQVNEFLQGVQQKAMDYYDKHKTYTPDMQTDIRSLMRKAARDPRINAWQLALKNEQDRKEIEKTLRLHGEEGLITHNHPTATPVYDNQGNMQYNPESTDLGIERKTDWIGSGSKHVNAAITPWLTQQKLHINHITEIGVDGRPVKLPVLEDTSGKQLRLSDPRVQQALGPLAESWINSSTEGRQWAKFNPGADPKQFLGSLLNQIDDVQTKGQPLMNKTWLTLLNSGGEEETPVESPYLASAYNQGHLGQKSSIGPTVNNPTRTPEITNYSELSKVERAKLYSDSKKEYEKYYRNNNMIENTSPEGVPSQGSPALSYNKWMESQGSVEGNPYGSFLQKHLESKQTSALKQTGLDIPYYSPEQSYAKAAEGKVSSITGSNALLLAAGQNSLKPMGQVLDGADIQNFHIEYGGHTTIIPSVHGGKIKATTYRVYLPKDRIKNMDLSEEALQSAEANKKVLDTGGKSQTGYPVTIVVPNKYLTSWQDAKEADYDQYGPDKQISSDGAYQASHSKLVNESILDEYNYKYEPSVYDNEKGYMVTSPSGKKGFISFNELKYNNSAEALIQHLENAK